MGSAGEIDGLEGGRGDGRGGRGGHENQLAEHTFSSLIATMELSSFVASVTIRRFAARLPLTSASGLPAEAAAGGALGEGEGGRREATVNSEDATCWFSINTAQNDQTIHSATKKVHIC